MDDRIAHTEQLQHLMETVACAHTFMAPATAQSATEAVLETISIDDVNAVAADMCAHILGFDAAVDGSALTQALPSAAIACAPASTEGGADPLDEARARIARGESRGYDTRRLL